MKEFCDWNVDIKIGVGDDMVVMNFVSYMRNIEVVWLLLVFRV